MAVLLPNGKQYYTTNGGLPLVGGKLYTYEAGTLIPKLTYSDAAATVPNPNPVFLDARGEAIVFWSGTYKVELRDSVDNVIWTIDNIVSSNETTTALIQEFRDQLADTDNLAFGDAMIGVKQPFVGSVATTQHEKNSWSVNIFDFAVQAQIDDVQSNAGLLDMSPAFAAAVASLNILGGGEIEVPPGTYRLNGLPGTDAYKNGILLSQTPNDFSTHRGIRIRGAGVDTVFKAGSADMVVIRHSRLYSGGANFRVDGNGFANVIGIGIVPESMTQVSSIVSQSHAIYNNLDIENCAEGMVFQPGPSINLPPFTDSGCFYHSITDVRINLCTRGIWMKKDVTGLGNRTTRTVFHHLIVLRANTGVQIDGGTEIVFVAPYFELINSGVTPSAIPTAFNYNDTNPANIALYGGYAEACTKAIVSVSPRQVALYGFRHNSTPDASEGLMLSIAHDVFNIPAFGSVSRVFKGPNGTEAVEIPFGGGAIAFTGAGNKSISVAAGSPMINGCDQQYWRAATGGVDVMRLDLTGTRSLFPMIDNAVILGQTGARWSAVWAFNGTIQTSDPRLKTNIADSVLGLDFIKALRPVSYKFKIGGNEVTDVREIVPAVIDDDGNVLVEAQTENIITPVPGKRQHFGFLSTEVKQALGGVDFGGWVKTDMNNPDSEEALRYDQFIAPLVRAVQELAAEVQALKNQLDAR